MKRIITWIGVFALIAIVSFSLVVPARAFDGRAGENITIAAGETVTDDLYVSANIFTLDGVVKGDLVVMAQAVIINGTVEGDLMAAGQTIIINGKVTDDARIAGYGLLVDKQASIADDLVSAGFSLETGKDTNIGGDLVFAGAQALLVGTVDGNALAAVNGLALRGSIGGDLDAAVGEATQEEGLPPSMFMPQDGIQISIPPVAPGLTIAEDATIGGDLHYTQTVELNLPLNVVAGKVTRTAPEVNVEMEVVPTPQEQVRDWGFGMLRSMVTLILIGLFMGWLFPRFMGATAEKLQAQFGMSIVWGLVGFASFWFALFVVIFAIIFGGILFGALSLGGLSATIIWLGILTLFASTLGLILVWAYLSKVFVASVLGKWLLKFISPNAAEHKVWPLVTGVIVLVFIIGMLRFPLAPLGPIGGLVNFLVMLLGLGALWLLGRERMAKKPEASVQ